MKKNYISLLAILSLGIHTYAQNGFCNTALPFCAGTTYTFPAGVNSGTAEAGPNYGCLLSQPNPAWYYMQVDQTGPINFHISTTPAQDIDFVCWGPFASPTDPCGSGLLTASCTSCPNNVLNPTFYPSGNMTDCSFSTGWEEDCHLLNAVSGEYYIFLITNYSNQACNIVWEQTNITAPVHGTTNYALVNQSGINSVNNVGTFSIFPNPMVNSTTVKFSNPTGEARTIRLFDITGKIVKVYQNVTDEMVKIDRENLSNGIYSLEMNSHRVKLVIE